MNKNIMFLMCLLMAIIWTAGCTCPGPRVAVAPAPVVAPAPPPPAPQPEVIKPKPVEEPVPSKKLKKRVIRETD